MNERLEQLLAFAKEIEKFKTIDRQMYCSNGRRESDAEHAWHLGMLVLLFDKELPPQADRLTMLKMALMHDLVEIYSGDTFAFDKEAQKTKKEGEQAAARKLFSQLPPDLREEFEQLYADYESQSTVEGQLMKALDKIQPTIQNLCTEGRAWKENNITYEQVDEYKRPLMKNPFIKTLYERIMMEAKERELL